MRRVVVSGLGSVSAAGATVPQAWEFLSSGKRGIRSLLDKHPWFAECGVQIGAPVHDDFNAEKWTEGKTFKSRGYALARASMLEALESSQFDATSSEVLAETTGMYAGNLSVN
jgi:3-oxoacyl-(acyl-carrier-protein) synthase